jgi:DNA-binding response OmpR family regulator
MIKRILVVEDSFEIRIGLEMAFKGEGFDVRSVPDAERGLLAFKQFAPDLALLDLRLPGMSGVELCRRIREVSHIPIVIFSAIEEWGEKVQAFEAGADDYVVKGTSIDELMARVQAHLRWERRMKPVQPEEAGDEGLAMVSSPDHAGPEEHGKLHAGVPPHVTPKLSGLAPRKAVRKGKLLVRPEARPPKVDIAERQGVVVLDPDPEARDKLARTLERLGHRVIQVTTAEQALRTVGKYLPWLVFCELKLTDMDGFKVLQVLSRHPRTQDVAVIVVSNNGRPSARMKAQEYGALDYITKPWQEHEIELRLRWATDVLDRRRLRRAMAEQEQHAKPDDGAAA